MNNSPSWFKAGTRWYNDEKMRIIWKMPGVGHSITGIWFKLLALAGKTNRSGEVWLGERSAYTIELLAPVFELEEGLLRLAIQTLLKLELIELLGHGQIRIVNWHKWQNVDALAKLRMNDVERERLRREQARLRSKRYRESKKQLDLSAKEQALLPMPNVGKIALVRPDGRRHKQCDSVNQSAQIESLTENAICDRERDEKRGPNVLVKPSVTQSVTESVTQRDGKRDAVEQMTQTDSFTREDKNVMECDGSVTQRDACVTRHVTQPHKSNNPNRSASRARAKNESTDRENENIKNKSTPFRNSKPPSGDPDQIHNVEEVLTLLCEKVYMGRIRPNQISQETVRLIARLLPFSREQIELVGDYYTLPADDCWPELKRRRILGIDQLIRYWTDQVSVAVMFDQKYFAR